MNGAGLAALVQGFQQGYTFMDDAERKKKQDERQAKVDTRLEETFARQKKQWEKSDQYDSDVYKWALKYGPKEEAAPPAPIASNGAFPSVPASAEGASGDGGTAVGAEPLQSSAIASPQGLDVSKLAPGQAQQLAAMDPQAFANGANNFARTSAAVQNASTGVPVAPKPKADPHQNFNLSLDALKERMMIDAKYGKLNGDGLISFKKMMDGMQREGFTDAIKLFQQGDDAGAVARFNQGGAFKVEKIVSAQDGVFKVGKTEVPTRIVTVQGTDGSIRTIDTAKSLYQMQDMANVFKQAQTDRELTVQEEYRDGMLGIQQQKLAMENEQFKRKSLAGQLDQLEAVLGPMEPEQRKKVAMKLAGVDKDEGSLTKMVDNVVEEGVKNGSIKPDDAVKTRNNLLQWSARNQAETVVSKQLSASKGTPRYAGDYAKASQIFLPVQLKAMGFEPPPPEKTGKPAIAKNEGTRPGSNDYAPPVNSPAGKTLANREAIRQAQERVVAKVRADFDTDASSNVPAVDIVRKYDALRGQLTPEQLQQLRMIEKTL